MMSAGLQAEVLDPELWERVSVAIPAVNAVIDEHLTAGKWVPFHIGPDDVWPEAFRSMRNPAFDHGHRA